MSTTLAELKLSDPRLFRQACYIDGQWVEAGSSRTIVVDDPATGEVIGNVPNLGTMETRRAIDAAAQMTSAPCKGCGSSDQKSAACPRSSELPRPRELVLSNWVSRGPY